LPNPEIVTLEVYDIIGRKVRLLVNEFLNAGRKRVEWDACDDNGAALPSGIYLYRVQAGDFSVAKKMILVR